MTTPTAVVTTDIKVQLDKREVVLSKLPIKRYTEVFDILDKIPQSIQTIDELSYDKILQTVPQLVKNSLPEVLKIVQIGTGIPQEEIDELALDEIIKLLAGIIEVNKYTDVMSQIKKLFAQPKQST